MLSCKHSGNLGDCIYSLPTIISIRKDNGDLYTNYYLDINKPTKNYLGSRHVLRGVRLNEDYFNKLKPLLESQNYIDNVEIYKNQELSFDLDEFRELNIDFNKGHIPRWYFYLFRANYDLSTPWISVTPYKKHKILVNRTERYRNININYSFLQEYNDITFVGLQDEYENFTRDVPNANFYCASNFLELAEVVAGCELFIGNQSFVYSIAEAIKVPRVLEACPFCPNVLPHGDSAWDCINQTGFETICRKEIEKLK